MQRIVNNARRTLTLYATASEYKMFGERQLIFFRKKKRATGRGKSRISLPVEQHNGVTATSSDEEEKKKSEIDGSLP